MEITREHVVSAQVNLIIEYKEAYKEVEAKTGVPWYIVGIMDIREGGGRACTHLHNGDPLRERTVHEPPNRPKNGHGPFTFLESACDALRLKKYDRITDWTVERMAYCFEVYNGFGYRLYRKMLSPYLWAATNHQQRGKYTSDKKFDRHVMDTQIGCMALLKGIADAENITIPSMYGATSDPTEPTPATNSKTEPEPQKPMMVGLGTLITGGTISAGLANTKEGVSVVKDIKSIAPPVSSYVYPSLIVALGLVAAVIIWRRTA